MSRYGSKEPYVSKRQRRTKENAPRHANYRTHIKILQGLQLPEYDSPLRPAARVYAQATNNSGLEMQIVEKYTTPYVQVSGVRGNQWFEPRNLPRDKCLDLSTLIDKVYGRFSTNLRGAAKLVKSNRSYTICDVDPHYQKAVLDTLKNNNVHGFRGSVSLDDPKIYRK